jgi:ribose/xylose/arabinose/galactoside ABC-type transport system permease subunit
MTDPTARFAFSCVSTLFVVGATIGLSMAGLPSLVVTLLMAVMFAGTFTLYDWKFVDRGPDASAFLRRRLTSNLILVSIAAAVLTAVLPDAPEKDDAAKPKTKVAQQLPSDAEDAR